MTYLTDITTTTQIAIGNSRRLSLRLPKLGIGRAISKMPSVVAHAFEMAYLVPFCASQCKPSTVIDEGVEGRDPSW